MRDRIAGIRRSFAAERGANAVEYGLIIAAIAAVVAVTIFALGAVTKGQISQTCDSWRVAANDPSICR